MPPNTIELPPMETDPEGMMRGAKAIDPPAPPAKFKERYYLMMFQSGLNLLAHLLIGMTVFVCFLFAFAQGLPLGRTPMHVVLCVTGYNLLMAQAILSMTTHNGWTSKFRLIDKRRAHWVMQILGSGLAIAGSFYKIFDKVNNGQPNWTSLHGQFALVALVFTVASLVNGIAALWAYELRRFLPGTVSKLTHICFGTVAFVAACICLCFGMDKLGFRAWMGNSQANTCIAFVAISTFIIIFNPLITFYNKSVQAIKT